MKQRQDVVNLFCLVMLNVNLKLRLKLTQRPVLYQISPATCCQVPITKVTTFPAQNPLAGSLAVALNFTCSNKHHHDTTGMTSISN